MNVPIRNLVALHQPDVKFVIDCGGYIGEYTDEILKRFDCKVLLFEPIPEYAEICRDKFKDKNVEIIQKAVGKDGQLEISKLGISSSQFRGGEMVKVESVSLVPFIKDVDILKLNCEGGEFDVIEDLDGHDLLKDIKEILVQFHKFKNINNYRNILSKTHSRTYSHKWDLWIKKQNV